MWINAIYKHPSYNRTTVENDLALIRLTMPLPKIPYLIEHIELNQDEKKMTTANQTVIVSGWGRTGRSLAISKKLLMASLKTIDNKQCQTMWNTSFKINLNTMICASDEDKSACNVSLIYFYFRFLISQLFRVILVDH